MTSHLGVHSRYVHVFKDIMTKIEIVVQQCAFERQSPF